MDSLTKSLKDSIQKFTSDPGRIFGLLYPYVLIIGIGIGLIYTANINEIARQDVAPKLADTLPVQDLKVTDAKSVPPIDIEAVKEASPELMSKGDNLYANICQSCHGEDGRGNGPGAAGLNPPPKDFSSGEGWKNGATISGIFTTLTEGIPGTAMIPYDYLTPEERIALAHYIRNNHVPEAPQVEEDELQTLDATYNLSAGAEIPAQIPVSAAVKLIIKETEDRSGQYMNILQGMAQSNQQGARIFDRITTSKIQAVSYLKSSDSWKSGDFKSYIIRGINRFTFNKQVFDLNEKEWNELRNFVTQFL